MLSSSPISINDMSDISLELRKRIIYTSSRKKIPHLGSCLSCIEILVYLYWIKLRIDPINPQSNMRDRFILSKGHACLGIYVVFFLKKIISKKSTINRPTNGYFKKLKTESTNLTAEFRVSEDGVVQIGKDLSVNHFLNGQYVDISGFTIGKGFAGGMKRHNFAGNRASHGVSISHRAHGSTGQNQDPGRVFKGKKMAGRMGNKKVTKQNLKVIDIDSENNLLMVKGSVPGKKNSIVYLKDSVKKSK